MDNEIIPPGKYRAKAFYGNFQAASTGTPELRVGFEVLSGPQEGQKVYGSLYFTQKTFERSMEACEYMGMTPEDVENQDIANLGSQECQIVVEHQEYNGETQARVKWVNSLRGPAQEVPPEAKNAFAEMARRYKQKKQKEAVNEPPPF